MEVDKRKVYGYVTHERRLLVFCHVDHPEAGIQVPGGTVEPGEAFDQAVMREAREETGLRGLELVRLVGEQVRDMSDFGVAEVHHQRFYHLRCRKEGRERWRHVERNASDGSGPIGFELWWADLDDLPPLFGLYGQFIPDLLQDL